MKKKTFSVFLTVALFITYLTIWTPRQLAKENNDVSNLALMLPDSDIIIALDVNKTLNVAGPGLLNQDEKKIDNLNKLMKSLENSIGINPYEISQIVAGIKVPPPGEKDIFGNLNFTVIFRTANSNAALLEDWSKKIDAIDALNIEKEPTEKYINAFRSFRYYKLSSEDTEKLVKSTKEFDEILKQTGQVNTLLSKLPSSAKAARLYKDAVKKNNDITQSINRYQTLLKQDTDVKNLYDSTLKLQNRWNEISPDDPNRAAKLAAILTEAKVIYPAYKTKTENSARIKALINISNDEFYEKLSKKGFGHAKDDDVSKFPNDMMKDKLDEIIKTLTGFSAAKQNTQLTLVSNNLLRLDDTMNIRLKTLDDVRKFNDPAETPAAPPKITKSLSKSIRDNAKVSEVNGKKMITIDLEKINFWDPSFGLIEEDKTVKDKETQEKGQSQTGATNDKGQAVSIDHMQTPDEAKPKDAPGKKDDKKKSLFAIGYLDDNTMVIGFEEEIRSILNRRSDYKNPKAAELINSFKNPLISFAMNSKVIRTLMDLSGTLMPKEPKESEKEVSPTEKFFSDVNIFGSIEFDADAEATNDLVMSLGFTKNKVEEIFKDDDSQNPGSDFDFGDYQFSKAIFYDLFNSLKTFKASVSFKFEKKKLAALIESAPQIIEDIRSPKTKPAGKPEKNPKTKIQNIQNIEDLLTSPKFYTDLAGIAGRKGG